ncbi:MAG: CsgG/HfaB family protein [Bacteroidales bacterium]
MKKTIKYSGFLFLSLLSFDMLMAQDIIMLKTGDEIKTKVIEVTSDQVKYKRYDNLNGPTYSYGKGEVFKITYESGKTEVMSGTASTSTLKKRVALGNIKDGSGWKEGNASAKLASVFSTELFKSGKYLVIEQDAIADLINEGNLSPVNLQKLWQAGVQILITGGITEYGVKTDTKTNSYVYYADTKTTYTAKVSFDVKIIDVATGDLLYAETAKGENTDTKKGAAVGGFSSNSGGFDETMLDAATRTAVQQCIGYLDQGMSKIKWSGSIAKVMGDTITYIKPGSNDGIANGMEFKVYDIGEQIIDPDLGGVLSNNEKYIGKIKVIELTPNGKAAKCQIIEGKDFKIGNIVRE